MKPYKNSERTKRWIREAFASLIVEKKCLENIKISELIERADITKPTFYYHYKDLNDLVKSIENEMIDELSLLFEEASMNKDVPLEHYISLLSEFLKKNEKEYKAMANATDLNYFIDKIKKILAKKIDDPDFGFSNDTKTRSIQRVFVSSACVDTLLEYFKGNIDGSIEEVEETIIIGINKLRG